MDYLNNLILSITSNKLGVEIGGPKLLDNVIFSFHTVQSNHTNEYRYINNKVGKVIVNDSTCIDNVDNNIYEHIANPLKVLYEWLYYISFTRKDTMF